MLQVGASTLVCYQLEIARVVGAPAAILLNKITQLSKSTRRKDGYCWYTYVDFERETNLKKTTYDRAVKALVNAGLVDKKVTYILGTTERANHFKLKNNLKDQSAFLGTSERPKLTKNMSNFRQNDAFCEYRKNNTNKNESAPTHFLDAVEKNESKNDGFGSAKPSRGTMSKKQDSTKSESHESDSTKTPPLEDPFSTPIVGEGDEVSVRPAPNKSRTNDANQQRKRAFAILGDLYTRFNLVGKPSLREAKLVMRAMKSDKFWDKETLGEAIYWGMHNEYYHDKPLTAILSESALKSFVAQRPGGMRKVPKGIIL